jgi:4-amino-4-deoxy-L-arabinose transferase-like glycosyltransferase
MEPARNARLFLLEFVESRRLVKSGGEGITIPATIGQGESEDSATWMPPPALLWAAFALFGVFHVYSLDQYPVFWGDESAYAEAAHTLVFEGVPRNPSFGEFGDVHLRNVLYGHLHLALTGFSEWIFGPSVRALRLPTLLMGLLALIGIYRIGKEFGYPQYGLIAAAWFGIGTDFSYYAHTARPEMMMETFAVWSTVFLARAIARERASLLFWSGLIISLSCEIHPNVVLFIVPIGLVSLFAFRWKVYWFVLGVLPPMILGIVLHIGLDPELFLFQWNEFWAPINGYPPFPVTSLGQRLHDLFISCFLSHFWLRPYHYKVPLGLLFLAGFLWGIWRRKDPMTRMLLFLLVILIVHWVFFMDVRKERTVPLAFPWLFLLSARFLCEFSKHLPWKKIPWKAVLIGVVGLYMASTTVYTQYIYTKSGQNGQRYFEYLDQINSHVPPDAKLLGSPALAYGMLDRPYHSYWMIWTGLSAPDGHHKYGSDVESHLDRSGIEYVVLELAMERFIQRWAPDRWEAIFASWEEVASFESRYYGAEGFGFRPGEPRTTRIMRIPRREK